MRCIRCKKEVYCRGDFRDWLVVTVDGVRKVVENDMHNIGFFDEAKNMVWVKHDFIGLCPDCQIERSLIVSPPKKDDVGIDVEKMLHQHEHDIETLGGCLAAMEKRTAKLEREMDRVWEIIRCKGRSEEHTSELQSHHDIVCRLLL